jgi:alpha-galactosidase
MAGIIINTPVFGNHMPGYILAMPDEVWMNTGGAPIMLTSTDKVTWTGKDVIVEIKQETNHLSVYVQSPTLPLYNVQLKWKYAIPSTSTCLGDAWERTYGDVSWQSPEATKKMPWYFMQFDGKVTNCFGVKTGASSICYWQISNNEIGLTLDTMSAGVGVQLGDRKLHAADVITSKSIAGETPFTTGQRFCKLMCASPRLSKQPVYGINDWYFAYGNNSSALILHHTALLVDLATDVNNRPFSVVDAGWAQYSPVLPNDCCWQDDYSRPNDKFKDRAKLAADVKKMGMRPALWTRPLCGRHIDPANLLLPAIEGRNDPKQPVLDPTIEENIERIKTNIALYKDWGFEMVKHDFSTYDMLGKWGFQMSENITPAGWRFNDNTKTSAEIILHLYRSIRKAAGDMYLIGCNTPGHLAAGIFEINRIGDDTSGNEWSRTPKMGVNTLAFRGIQHNHFYAADADCVGLTTKIPWSKNKQWMQLLAESGTPLLISAQPDAVGAEQKGFIKKCFTAAAKKQPIGEPLDWMASLTPAKWKLDGKVVNFDWT